MLRLSSAESFGAQVQPAPLAAPESHTRRKDYSMNKNEPITSEALIADIAQSVAMSPAVCECDIYNGDDDAKTLKYIQSQLVKFFEQAAPVNPANERVCILQGQP